MRRTGAGCRFGLVALLAANLAFVSFRVLPWPKIRTACRDKVGRKLPSCGLQSKNRIVMALAFAYTVIFARG
ncbi:hypothetical protein GCM10011290_10960 [Vogesella alkaliphila]|uniref:Secreted protein n=1 Tax=Vogesella alkaliphila TaxID=1193621 RepID=A0ABQ2YIX6_9NEIS|nr:hypothetical protein GCM10011290_10960 [Vogesella alkaliphila]